MVALRIFPCTAHLFRLNIRIAEFRFEWHGSGPLFQGHELMKMAVIKKAPLAMALLLAASVCSAAEVREELQPTGRFNVYGHGAAATPPMGWNPWNAFRTEVTQDKILSVAETIKKSGLQAAGYRYINIDDGWWLNRRADGGIEIRTSMFPMAKTESGPPSFKAWTDHLHGMGFKAGIYTDVGRNACSQAHDPKSPNLPVGTIEQREIGLWGFEYSDLKTVFQDWGFDYVKVDACGLADFGPGGKAEQDADHEYQQSRALIVRGDAQATDAEKVETAFARAGRLLDALNPDGDFVFSICPWGEAGVGNWGGRHGNSWRTSEDITPTWQSMLHNFDTAARRELYAGPGRWNDPDMLAIGLGEFDEKNLVQAQTHFSIWSILASPLLIGFDLNHASPELMQLLSNAEVIAVNQDAAGNQGNLVATQGDVQVLVKPLSARGERAVLLVNRGEAPAEASVTPAQMKLKANRPIAVRDLWTHSDLPAANGALKFTLEPHASVMLKVSGAPATGTATGLTEVTGRIHVAVDGLPTYSAKPAEVAGTPRADATPYGKRLSVGGRGYDYGIGVHANSRLEVRAGKDFTRFTAQVGVDDSASLAREKVTFWVYGDGKPLFASKPMTRGDAPAQITVQVANVEVIELVAVADGIERGRLAPVVAWVDAALQ